MPSGFFQAADIFKFFKTELFHRFDGEIGSVPTSAINFV